MGRVPPDENQGSYGRRGQYGCEDGCTCSGADSVYEESCSDRNESGRDVYRRCWEWIRLGAESTRHLCADEGEPAKLSEPLSGTG